ncbi:MAG: hypothetical protein ACI90V_012178 [Bacillariaceae sp.]|jgi:hypothetical protein
MKKWSSEQSDFEYKKGQLKNKNKQPYSQKQKLRI